MVRAQIIMYVCLCVDVSIILNIYYVFEHERQSTIDVKEENQVTDKKVKIISEVYGACLSARF